MPTWWWSPSLGVLAGTPETYSRQASSGGTATSTSTTTGTTSATLHGLSPTAFEEFCLYVLRECGLELVRVGGSGDEGIDGIGTAPISDVLSATVAVQDDTVTADGIEDWPTLPKEDVAERLMLRAAEFLRRSTAAAE